MQSIDPHPAISELFDLTGRVALVTGAGGYLGTAMAHALAEAGARVIVTSRSADRANEVARSFPASQLDAHIGIELDQLDLSVIDRAFDDALSQAGRIDVLVNNAHEAVGADLLTVQTEQFNRQLSHATAYFLLARRLRDHAVDCGKTASIVMVGSMYGVVGSYPDAYDGISTASSVAYHALKGGIVQMTRHLAVYWARDRIRVNCLSPGPFPPPHVDEELRRRLSAKSPLGRVGKPHELKGALLLLASDAGSYITGHNLMVDGGWSAW